VLATDNAKRQFGGAIERQCFLIQKILAGQARED
jgi:hypothetical protein